jgi:hypothetical protein
MSSIHDNLDRLLVREAGAQALTAAGYPTSAATLATKATRGGGPPYRIFGKRAIYRWGDLLAWAEANTSPLRTSTSEIGLSGAVNRDGIADDVGAVASGEHIQQLRQTKPAFRSMAEGMAGGMKRVEADAP